MRRGPIRRLVLRGDPEQRGTRHGSRHRDEIRRYADERVRLATEGLWADRRASRDDVLALAHAMLPAHRDYAPDLHAELEAMARASGLTPEEAVIVGGFTDFVDALRGLDAQAPQEDDCTAVLVPPARAEGRAFLAQTWDMHDSATEHVLMLEVVPERGPAAFVFSTVGCVGQIGLNEAGICVGINNLSALRGRAGVTWPFVVRKALQQTDLDAALAAVLDADLAGAHNYLLLDDSGRGFDVEAMPDARPVSELGAEPLIHTNHCLDPEARREEAEKAPQLRESSERRLLRARELLRMEPITLKHLIDFTRDPQAICQRATPPFHMESSGAAIMRPASGELWAVWGLPIENEYERFAFPPTGEPAS